MDTKNRPEKLYYIPLVFIVPLIFLFCTLQIRATAESIHVWSDPSFYLLVNFWSIADFNQPAWWPHPSLTMQYLGGLLVLLYELVSAETNHIATPATTYFLTTNTLLALNVFCILGLGWFLIKKGFPVGIAVVAQLLCVSEFCSYWYNSTLTTENLMIPLAIAFGLLLIDRVKTNHFLLIGTTCLGLITKLTLLPFILSAFSFKSNLKKAIGLIAPILFFILALNCFENSLENLLNNYFSVATKDGSHTNGAFSILNLSIAYERISNIFTSFKSTSFAALFCLLLATFSLVNLLRKKTPFAAERNFYLLIAIAFASIIMFVRKPYAAHYLMPAIALLPFLFLHNYRYNNQDRHLKYVLLFSTVAFLLFNFNLLRNELRLQAMFIDYANRQYKSAKTLLDKYHSCAILILGPITTEAHSLKIGNEFTRHVYKSDLEKQYPHIGFVLDKHTFRRYGTETLQIRYFREVFGTDCGMILVEENIAKEPRNIDLLHNIAQKVDAVGDLQMHEIKLGKLLEE